MLLQSRVSKEAVQLLFVTILVLVTASPRLFAQSLVASITGKVADASGVPIAGATVTVTGPALQVPQITSVSDNQGNYSIVDLPAPASYRIQFELTGFQKLVQSDVHLTVSLQAGSMRCFKIGTVTQTVEVTGSNPVLDPVSVKNTATLPETEIADVPRGLRTQELLTQTPGVSMAGPPDVGDSTLALATTPSPMVSC